MFSLSGIQRLAYENKEMPNLPNQINKLRRNYNGHYCQSHSELYLLRAAGKAIGMAFLKAISQNVSSLKNLHSL